MEARDYFNAIENPWHKLKNEQFNGYDKYLHASDLQNPTRKKIEILNQFFTENDFGRFATVCTDKSVFDGEFNVEDVLMATLWDRIKGVGNRYRWNDILVIYEENERLMPAFKKEFMPKILKNKNDETIQVNYTVMPKDPVFSGLEVADFIVHTAGRQARITRDHNFDKNIQVKQPDFEVVFSSTSVQSFFSISKVSQADKLPVSRSFNPDNASKAQPS